MRLLDKLGEPMGMFGVSRPGPLSEEFAVDAPIGAGWSDRDVAFHGTLESKLIGIAVQWASQQIEVNDLGFSPREDSLLQSREC
jgi:hypothetical protein